MCRMVASARTARRARAQLSASPVAESRARRRSRRPDSGDGRHGENSLRRHPQLHVAVLACGPELAQPVRREPRLRQSRQCLQEAQESANEFLLTPFISKISRSLRFLGLGGSPSSVATSRRTKLSGRTELDSPKYFTGRRPSTRISAIMYRRAKKANGRYSQCIPCIKKCAALGMLD
jgi:hypothetical protein